MHAPVAIQRGTKWPFQAIDTPSALSPVKPWAAAGPCPGPGWWSPGVKVSGAGLAARAGAWSAT